MLSVITILPFSGTFSCIGRVLCNKVLKGVEVCYVVGTDSPGSTYISEINVEMMTPDELIMIHGDKPNLSSNE